MNTDTEERSTVALATHCYAILMTAMPAVSDLAQVHGVLLTEDALHFIEDTAATCLIQSAIAVARAGGYEEHGIDFATVDAIACGKKFVELSQCPEFRESMVRARLREEVKSESESGEVESEGESEETIGPSDNETIRSTGGAGGADGLPVVRQSGPDLSDGLPNDGASGPADGEDADEGVGENRNEGEEEGGKQ